MASDCTCTCLIITSGGVLTSVSKVRKVTQCDGTVLLELDINVYEILTMLLLTAAP